MPRIEAEHRRSPTKLAVELRSAAGVGGPWSSGSTVVCYGGDASRGRPILRVLLFIVGVAQHRNKQQEEGKPFNRALRVSPGGAPRRILLVPSYSLDLELPS